MDAEEDVKLINFQNPEPNINNLIELKKQSSVEETDEAYGKDYDSYKINQRTKSYWNYEVLRDINLDDQIVATTRKNLENHSAVMWSF